MGIGFAEDLVIGTDAIIREDLHIHTGDDVIFDSAIFDFEIGTGRGAIGFAFSIILDVPFLCNSITVWQ